MILSEVSVALSVLCLLVKCLGEDDIEAIGGEIKLVTRDIVRRVGFELLLSEEEQTFLMDWNDDQICRDT